MNALTEFENGEACPPTEPSVPLTSKRSWWCLVLGRSRVRQPFVHRSRTFDGVVAVPRLLVLRTYCGRSDLSIHVVGWIGSSN